MRLSTLFRATLTIVAFSICLVSQAHGRSRANKKPLSFENDLVTVRYDRPIRNNRRDLARRTQAARSVECSATGGRTTALQHFFEEVTSAALGRWSYRTYLKHPKENRFSEAEFKEALRNRGLQQYAHCSDLGGIDGAYPKEITTATKGKLWGTKPDVHI
jgi:hypothetical protein